MTKSNTRPPKAVVGSQFSRDEEIFGSLYDRKVIRRFIGYVRQYRRGVLAAIGAVLIYTAAQLSIPLIIRHTIDDAIISSDQNYLLITVTVFLGFISVSYAANYVQDRLVGLIGERVIFDLRRAMFAHLQNVSLSFMDKTEVGRMMSRLQGDVNSLQEFLENSITAFGDIVLLVGIVVIMLSLNLELGLVSLALVPTLAIVRAVWLPRARLAFRRARETNSITNGALAEMVHAIRTIQGMRRETVNARLYDDLARSNLNAHLRSAKYAQVMVPIVDTLTGAALAIVVIIGGGLVLDGAMEVGVMVAFLFYVQRFFDPIRSLTIQYSVMQRAMASGQRIFEVLDVPLAITDRPSALNPNRVKGAIEFENVSFGYVKDQLILRDISFSIKPGETIALVGPTGSGKTSITSLLHRFYKIGTGTITIDGSDIRYYTKDALARNIAMVLQDPYLFTGTVMENLRFSNHKASRKEVERAATLVGAHDFITQLRDGYDTVLDQQGRNLSLGQRQLLSFARALVANAPILVLDEATASIDSYTERRIQTALLQLLKGRTAIIIAHRLTTIRGADRIIVLNDGRIVEMGNHKDLIAEKGLYARLYAYNYASFDDIPKELVNQAADAPTLT